MRPFRRLWALGLIALTVVAFAAFTTRTALTQSSASLQSDTSDYAPGDTAILTGAGFQPLEVIEHATWNGARLLGMEDRLGKVREGFIADLLVVNGNPLDNLRLLNPYGADVMLLNGKPASNYTPIGAHDRAENAHGGGIEWTIKDGIPYHVPTLMREVKDMVAKARADRARQTTAGR